MPALTTIGRFTHVDGRKLEVVELHGIPRLLEIEPIAVAKANLDHTGLVYNGRLYENRVVSGPILDAIEQTLDSGLLRTAGGR